MLSSHTANQENRSMMYLPHMPSPLSSSPIRFSPSPPSSPTTSSNSRYTHRLDCIMSSPCKPLRQLSIAQTPQRLHSRSTHTTPTSTRRLDSSITMSHGSSLNSRFSMRQTKPNPLMPQRGLMGQQDGRETKRILFLNHIKEANQDKRWHRLKSGFRQEDEHVLRALWLKEKKEWQEQRRREAQSREIPIESEELTDEARDTDYELAEVEALFLDEENNIPQEFLRRNNSQPNLGERPTTEMVDGIDDDEYDHIFMEIIQREKNNLDQSFEQFPSVEDHEMVDFS